MAGNGIANRTRSGGKGSPRENKRKKESPCNKVPRKCSPGQNARTKTPKDKGNLKESIGNKLVTEVIEISSSVRESNVKYTERVDEETLSPNHGHTFQNSLEVVKEILEIKSSFDYLFARVNNLTRMVTKEKPHFTLTPSLSGLPLTVSPLHRTESTKTKRQRSGGPPHLRELFTPNYQTLNDWNVERISNVEVPEWMPVSFRPPNGMLNNELEAAVAAYIFQSKIRETQNDEEILVDCSWGYVNRGCLKSLFPKKFMDQEVLNMLAARLTHNERSIMGFSTTWFLPTIFSQYALDWGTTPEEIRGWYQKNYMGTVEFLRKIFIPINDDNVHWYLLVVDFRINKLIILDSLPSNTRSEIRKLNVTRLSCFLEAMFLHSSFYEHKDSEKPKVSQFVIVEPEGIREQPAGSNDCGVWVAQWMIKCADCEDYDKVNVDHSSRMRVAIDSVMHPYNKIKDEVARKAIKWWTDLEAARKNLVKTND